MAYQKKGDLVVLTITEDQHAWLFIIFGMALGTSDSDRFRVIAAVLNAIEEGNPDFRPIKVRE